MECVILREFLPMQHAVFFFLTGTAWGIVLAVVMRKARSYIQLGKKD